MAEIEATETKTRKRSRRKTTVVGEATSTAVEEEQKTTATGSDTVMVAMNRAQGVNFALDDGRTVWVAGNAVHLKGKEMGILPKAGSFGLTTMARPDWEQIKAKFGATALFRSGRIFASDDKASALAEARDRADTRNGLEAASTKGATKPAQAGV